MFDFAHEESLRFVNAMVDVPKLGRDVLRNPEYGRSAIGAERSILIPS